MASLPRATLRTDSRRLKKAQYVYGGQNYCEDYAGWNGPGWCWCGYASRVGLGWGGVYAWNGWRGGYGVRPGHGYRRSYGYHGAYRGGHRGGVRVRC
jgi:hypothetical protein